MGVNAPCVLHGYYCGGDKVDGDPRSLYQCEPNGSGGVMAVFRMKCPNGCIVGAAGVDDACA
jgi:hypothetical protein